MDYPVRTEGSYTVISLSGEIDLNVSPGARGQMLDELGKNRHVLVDLSAVEYIDSSGIATLVEGLRAAKDNELRFGLVGVSDAAMQVLQLARLDQVFDIHASVGERIEADG